MNKTNTSRRNFLKQLAGGSLAASPLSSLLFMRQAMAADDYSGLTDYKALVCVYLHGGNDAFNMFVPTDTSSYNAYSDLRGALAVPKNDLLSLKDINYGFHPRMPKLQALYNQDKLGLVSNVGNLFEPLNKQEYIDWEQQNGGVSVTVPPDLFSHSDQTHFWQTGYAPNSLGGSISGWGGRMAELLAASNNSSSFVPITMTLDGHSPWQTAENTSQLSLNAWDGINDFSELTGADWPEWASRRKTTWEQLLALSANSDHALQQQIEQTIQRTRSRVSEVKTALENTWDSANDKDIFATPYNANNDLASQLRMVARMIHNRVYFGQKRQVFLVALGGWDTHGSQANNHPELLGTVDDAMDSFYQTLSEMSLQQSVTTFTASEFGRTLGINGDGTDHGWGTHHLVMGGAVAGGQVHGALPVIARDSADDIGDAILPQIATDQYGATLANWLGITNADLDLIFPNLGNFSTRNLGFMS